MTNLSQLLPRSLKISLLVACFDSQYSFSDDIPSLDKHFVVKVEASIKGMTDVHTYIPQCDECNGLAETLWWFWRSTGYSNSLGSERLCLHTDRQGQVVLTWLKRIALISGNITSLKWILTGRVKSVPSAWARARHTCTDVFKIALSVISRWFRDFPSSIPNPSAPVCRSRRQNAANPEDITSQPAEGDRSRFKSLCPSRHPVD